MLIMKVAIKSLVTTTLTIIIIVPINSNQDFRGRYQDKHEKWQNLLRFKKTNINNSYDVKNCNGSSGHSIFNDNYPKTIKVKT